MLGIGKLPGVVDWLTRLRGVCKNGGCKNRHRQRQYRYCDYDLCPMPLPVCTDWKCAGLTDLAQAWHGKRKVGVGVRETHTVRATAHIAIVALMALISPAARNCALHGFILHPTQRLRSLAVTRVVFVREVAGSILLLATHYHLFSLYYVYFLKSIYARVSM